jgi:hypothetical protein
MTEFGTDRTVSKTQPEVDLAGRHLLHDFQDGAKNAFADLKGTLANLENRIINHPGTALATLAVGAAALYLSKGKAVGEIGHALLKDESLNATLELPSLFEKTELSGGRKLFTESLKTDARGRIYERDPGKAYALQDGGSLTIQDNNKAQITDATGQSESYNYYANNDGDGWHTIYKDSHSPREIADSIRQFRLDPEAGAATVDNAVQIIEPTYSVMHPSKLTPAERQFVDENVPTGSKPIGMGIRRQAWKTPENKAVVVGTNDHRPEAPFLLPAEKTEVFGNKKAETFSLGENKSISKNDVDEFVRYWSERGWEMRDNKISNFARTSDGKMWRVDPDDLFNWNE